MAATDKHSKETNKMRTLRIPEIIVPQHRLGRNINHDPRSLRYKVAPARVDKSVEWTRRVPVFDQGNLGSCTGNAEAGLLGTNPFFDTLPTNLSIDEALAVKIYSMATQIDPFEGEWPPDDTGSDGLSVSKAAQQMGFISGYVWATSVDEAKTLIQQGPFIIGTEWTSNMDKPNASGVIKNPAGGMIRGGHEYECFKRDASADLWWFYNSWGDSWGKQGTFAYNSAGMAALLARMGDVTQSVPLASPPPEPTTDTDLVDWWKLTKPWALPHAGHPKKTVADKAAHACIDLAKKRGL
jgi:hypothetical protein